MTKLTLCVIATYFSISIQQTTSAQSLRINTDGSTANAGAMLDVKNTVKGVLIPRMTKANKNAIPSPATGLLIFQDAPDSKGLMLIKNTTCLHVKKKYWPVL
jgi:hypothetical protein